MEAFEAYAVVKLGKDKTVSLGDKQAAVVGYLAQLPALLNAVQALVGAAPPTSVVQPRNIRDPLEAIARLSEMEVLRGQ